MDQQTAQPITAQRLLLQTAAGMEVPVALAGIGARSLAFLIDWHIRLIVAAAWVFGGLLLLGGGTLRADPPISPEQGITLVFAVVLPAFAIYFLYHPLLELVMQGRTPGKRMTGIRIVNRSGHTAGAGPIILRNLFRVIDSLPGYYVLGLAVAAFNRESSRIGDIAAGTLLVYEEKAEALTLSPLLTGDSRLPPAWRELLADLLERWRGLLPEVRAALAERLLTAAGRPLPPQTGRERDGALRAELSRLLNGEAAGGSLG